jgi:hypothetical protein
MFTSNKPIGYAPKLLVVEPAPNVDWLARTRVVAQQLQSIAVFRGKQPDKPTFSNSFLACSSGLYATSWTTETAAEVFIGRLFESAMFWTHNNDWSLLSPVDDMRVIKAIAVLFSCSLQKSQFVGCPYLLQAFNRYPSFLSRWIIHQGCRGCFPVL